MHIIGDSSGFRKQLQICRFVLDLWVILAAVFPILVDWFHDQVPDLILYYWKNVVSIYLLHAFVPVIVIAHVPGQYLGMTYLPEVSHGMPA